MSTHTLAPWIAQRDEAHFDTLSTVVAQTGEVRRGLGARLVVQVGGWADVREQEANTRLIAAAPDLLAACKSFELWLRREDEGFVKAGNDRTTPEGENNWREWYYENLRLCHVAMTQARAAIAIAEGKT